MQTAYPETAMTPEAIASDEGLGVPLIKVSEIYLDHDFNCRGFVSPASCIELAGDIAEKGLQQPIVVRSLRTEERDKRAAETDLIEQGYKYVVIAGHRRLTAYKINKHPLIPAFIKDAYISEFDAHDLNAVENLQRLELNLEQECNAIKHYWMLDWSREEVAARVNKSPGWVQVRYMLLDMPKEIQEAAGQGYIKTQDVRELHKFRGDTNEQLRLAGVIRDRRKDGEKGVVRKMKIKDKPSTKKTRGRAEIFEMMDYIRQVFVDAGREEVFDPLNEIRAGDLVSSQGNGFPIQCLAWATGELTTLEFHEALRQYAAAFNVGYELPDFPEEGRF